MLRLILQSSDGEEIRKFPLKSKPDVSIGRSSDNDVVLVWEGVSRHHARVRTEAGSLWIEDCGSKNGLLIEDRKMGRVRLEPGISIQIGDGFLTLEEIDTTDVEIAIDLGGPASDDGPRSSTREETRASRLTDRSAESALQWLAACSEEINRSEWIRAADLLGADGLSILRRPAEGDGEIEMCVGRFEEKVFEVLVFDAQARREVASELRLEPSFAAHPAGSGRYLVASLAPGRTLDLWQRNFLRCLARGLAPDSAAGCLSRKTESQGQSRGMRPEIRSEGLRLPPGMVQGPSDAMDAMMATIREIAGSDFPILIQGPTGSGKELVARCLHLNGRNPEGPFVTVQCTDIPENLIEAELFGIVGKAATDVSARKGRVEQADGGTLFLDEIGDLPAHLQVKLLRMLQEKEIWPIGADKPRKVKLQILSATHVDLQQAVENGDFRQDLFYRLAGFQLSVPSLDQRRQDIPEFISFFVREAAGQKRIPGVSRRVLKRLQEQPWPGNVRQLRRAVEVAVSLARDGEALEEQHLRHLATVERAAEAQAEQPAQSPAAKSADGSRDASPHPIQPLQELLETHERRAIRQALQHFQGNRSKAAAALGISRHGLRLKIRRLGLEPSPGPR